MVDLSRYLCYWSVLQIWCCNTGQINAIGGWVLRTACAQNQAWQIAGLPPVRVAVNLSGRQFQSTLTRLIAQVLSDTGLDPGKSF